MKLPLPAKPIHPLNLKAVPVPSAPERARLADGIRKHGSLIHPIILKEGYVIDGRTRQELCYELSIEPRYTEYEGSLTVPEYILQSNNRRNLTAAQMDSMILILAEEVVPQLREEAKQAKKNGNAKGGGTPRLEFPRERVGTPDCSGETQKRFRKLVGHTRKADAALAVIKHPDLAKAVEQGTMSLLEAHATAVDRNRDDAKLVAQPRVASENQRKWQATIDAQSIYPLDAKIPQGDTPEEKQVREAIRIARENEQHISAFGVVKLQDLVWRQTMCIQGYCENRHDRPRPEGPLDERLNEWAKSVARKHQARQLILQELKMQESPRKRRPERASGARFKKNGHRISGFDGVFNRYWKRETVLLREMRMYGFKTFSERWLVRAEAYFNEVKPKQDS